MRREFWYGDTVFSYENLNELAWIVGLEGKSNFNISRFYINSSLTLMKGGSGGKSISNIPPPRLYINFWIFGELFPLL